MAQLERPRRATERPWRAFGAVADICHPAIAPRDAARAARAAIGLPRHRLDHAHRAALADDERLCLGAFRIAADEMQSDIFRVCFPDDLLAISAENRCLFAAFAHITGD
jgi:hypothetical protein